MSRFSHCGFSNGQTVNGLPMYVTHINVYNTNEGNITPKNGIISVQKCHTIHPKEIFLQRIFKTIQSCNVKYSKSSHEPSAGGEEG